MLLKTIAYLPGKADIHASSVRGLRQLATWMCLRPGLRIEVGVHTDSRGSSIFNRAISQQRASAVQAALQQLGIHPDRVVAKGYGEEQPLANQPPAKQRRIELRVLSQ